MSVESEYDTEQALVVQTIETASALASLNASEIEAQLGAAKRWPRSVSRFSKESHELLATNAAVAEQCTYTLPRKTSDGKRITGPSVRFAEILAAAWGNCRVACRLVEEQDKFVVAQGIFLDLEHNVGTGYEVRRRITKSDGTRYGDDMIGVTSNAACAIAYRNAVLHGIPKALWEPLWQLAQKTARGDEKTLGQRRAELVKAFAEIKVNDRELLALAGVEGVADIGLDELVELRAVYTAIRDGDTTVDRLLGDRPRYGTKAGRSAINDELPPEKTKSASLGPNGSVYGTSPASFECDEEGKLTPEAEARAFKGETKQQTNAF